MRHPWLDVLGDVVRLLTFQTGADWQNRRADLNREEREVPDSPVALRDDVRAGGRKNAAHQPEKLPVAAE